MRPSSIQRTFALTTLLLTTFASSSSAQFIFGDTLVRYEVTYSFRYSPEFTVFQVLNTGIFFGKGTSASGPWIGGIFAGDTVVKAATNSTYAEGFFPGSAELLRAADFFPVHRSIAGNTAEDQRANALDEVVMHFGSGYWPILENDTVPAGFLTLAIKQTSYYWPVEYARDMLLIDYEITNQSFKSFDNVYLGIFFPGQDSGPANTTLRNVYGFLKDAPAFTRESESCSFTEEFNIAWVTNSDGNPDPFTGEFGMFARTNIAGIIILNPSAELLKTSWN